MKLKCSRGQKGSGGVVVCVAACVVLTPEVAGVKVDLSAGHT